MSRVPDLPPDRAGGAVGFAFLERYYADWLEGAPAELQTYLDAFPGHTETVTREFRRLAELADDDLTDDRQIGPYQLRREIGRGGQAVVYEALDPRLKRRVALKVLRIGPVRSWRALERFRREAEVASRIERRELCAIYGAGEEQGLAWIAMRLVEGETLATIMDRWRREGVLPSGADLDAILRWLETVLVTLDDVHRVGLVHRDLKPGNIMIEDAGPVILDFGLARIQDPEDGSAPTLSREQLGTPAYMSPEQVRGDPADARSDVFACGLVLYELVTLQHPFAAATREQMFRRSLAGGLDDPRRANPDVSKDLATVLHTALANEVDGRYQSAAAFAEDLRRVRERRPILARRPGPLSRAWLWSRRNRALAVSLALLFLVLAGGLCVTTLLTWRLQGEQETTRRNLERSRALALSAAAREQASESPLTGLLLALRARDARSDPETLSALYQCFDRTRILAEHRAPAGTLICGEVLPGKRCSVLGYADGKVRFLLAAGEEVRVADTSAVTGLLVSGDGKSVYSCSSRGGVKVWQVDGARELAAWRAPSTVLRVSEDPVTQTIAFGDLRGAVWTWTRAQRSGGLPPTKIHTAPGGVIRVLYGPADSQLLVLSVKGSAEVVDAEGLVQSRWATDGRWVACFLDRHRIATTGIAIPPGGEPQPGVMMHDLRNGRTRRIPNLYRLRDMVAGRDSETLYLAGDDGRVGVLRLVDQKYVDLPGHTDHVHSIRLDAEGCVLTASQDQTLRWTDPRTMVSQIFRGHQGRCSAARFAADGSFLSVGGDGVAMWWSRRGPADVAIPARIPWTGRAYQAPGGGLYVLGRDRVYTVGDGVKAEIPCRSTPRRLQFSKDGLHMLLRMKEGRTELFHVEGDGRPVRGVRAPFYGVRCRSVFLAEGRVFTAVTRKLYVWDATGEVVHAFQDSQHTVGSVVAGPRGERVACGDNVGGIRIYHVDGTVGPRLTVHDRGVLALAFHPDGNWIASSALDGAAKVTDLEGRTKFECDARGRRVKLLQFSPDGRYLLAAAEDGSGSIFRVADGRCIATPESLGGAPVAAVFSHDGRYVALAGSTGRVLLISMAGAGDVWLPRLSWPATGLEFAPDDRFLFASGIGARVCRWPVRPADLEAAARGLAVRDFTPEERRRFRALLEDGR